MSRRYVRELSVGAAYVLLLAALAGVHPDFFRRVFAQSWVYAAPVLVAAVGMTLVILARQIDISIGSQFSVCAVVAGSLAQAGWPMPAVAGGTLLAGGAMGAINGGLVAIGWPSIVVTLATMVIWRESLRWVRQGAAVHTPAAFQWFGQSQLTGEIVLVGVAGAVFVLFACGLRWLSAGRAIYAVGSDQEAARLAGIRPRRVILSVFIVMGILTALAALLEVVRFPLVDPNAGLGRELEVIAAVVVGGVAISGGRGTLIGVLIGVALLGIIPSALTFLHVQSQWAKAIQGTIILLAVASDGLIRRAR